MLGARCVWWGKSSAMTAALSVVVGDFGRISILTVDQPVMEHAHPQCHVLIRVGGADSRFVVEGRQVPLREGTAVLVDSWRPHSYPYPHDLPGSTVLALYVEPKWLAQVDRKFSVSGRRDFFLHPCVELPPAIQSTAMEIAEELCTIRPDRALVVVLVQRLMVEIIVRYSRWREMRIDFGPITNRVSDFRVRKAMEIMATDIAGVADADLGHVARQVGLSRAHFFDLFKRDTSLTPRLFWNMLRMEEAYRRITRDNDPLVTISHNLGFRAQPQFTRFFAQNHGVPPSTYRKLALHA